MKTPEAWTIPVRVIHTTHTHTENTHIHTTLLYMHIPSPLPAKKKLVELKTLFWSRPDVYNKYMDHELPSSDDEDDTAAEDEDGETTDEHEWVPSDENDGGDDGDGDSNGSNDDDSNRDNEDSNGDKDDDDDEVSEANSDCYYRYAVNDEIDAYWGGGPMTVPCWMDAVIVALKPESDLYEVRWTFNAEKVSWVSR